ncbi:hypothetical protein HN858_00520 [Candidatus Falkowbacteria bacterium]|jgi:hypothetical protein|nr:hypothetical protein [Candidatus Falkowbacteria bacterium]MBT5503748.1 hypothetical protein [Candidatus Falkowbacteria bacterium]MBT6573773.1 hypothetical protein [Candidatus Falkowbacteria bacterium]MBT7348137.1 hypothetical protein [Candidatus Falkowbacteria bacterium]MBT7500723.1 hypothetical protein [Candidatus Falkowbacteria bacterium]
MGFDSQKGVGGGDKHNAGVYDLNEMAAQSPEFAEALADAKKKEAEKKAAEAAERKKHQVQFMKIPEEILKLRKKVEKKKEQDLTSVREEIDAIDDISVTAEMHAMPKDRVSPEVSHPARVFNIKEMAAENPEFAAALEKRKQEQSEQRAADQAEREKHYAREMPAVRPEDLN